jgi:hypothetical protein
MVLVGISILGIFLFHQFDDLVIQKTPISKFSDAGKTHVVYLSGDNYEIKSFEKEPIFKDGKVFYTEIHPVVIISGIITFISLLIITFATLINDGDVGWELRDCISSTKIALVKCEIEDDIYYYHYKRKLLCKSDRQLWSSQIINFIDQPINLFPDFPGTKSQRRDKKLKELFK